MMKEALYESLDRVIGVVMVGLLILASCMMFWSGQGRSECDEGCKAAGHSYGQILKGACACWDSEGTAEPVGLDDLKVKDEVPRGGETQESTPNGSSSAEGVIRESIGDFFDVVEGPCIADPEPKLDYKDYDPAGGSRLLPITQPLK